MTALFCLIYIFPCMQFKFYKAYGTNKINLVLFIFQKSLQASDHV